MAVGVSEAIRLVGAVFNFLAEALFSISEIVDAVGDPEISTGRALVVLFLIF